MVKKLSVFAGLVLLASFLLWRIAEAPTEQHAAKELRMKEQILQEDLAVTESLCLHHCSTSMANMLSSLQQNNSTPPTEQIKELQKNNPNIKMVIWHGSKGEKKTFKTKDTPNDPSFLKTVEKNASKAKKALERSDSFTSEKIMHGPNPYRMIGLKQHDVSIVALIDHTMIPQLAVEQRKNLRIVPYPSEHRSKLKSVDPETMQRIQVDDPEDNEGTSHYYDGEVVVRFHQELQLDQLRQLEQETSSEVAEQLEQTYVFRSKSWSTKQLMDYFNEQELNIQYVEPNYLYLTNQENENTPNDTLFTSYQWNLPAIDTLDAWNVSRGSDDVVIAVLDTGVDLQHTDLQGQLVDGINIVDEQAQPSDDVGHGTHVTGVIAATVNNHEGIAGVSWYNKVMPVKVLDSTGVGSTYAVAQGIIWATDHGAKVINMSLGNYAEAQFLHDAIRYAYERDVLLVAATGNDATSQPGYPAAYPEVLAVSATDQNRNIASFSNYGEYVDVVAPGVNIASTYPGGQYVAMSGTSMATPHVAALAAMIRSANPTLSNVQVMDMIRHTANDLGQTGKDEYYGYGEINMASALGLESPNDEYSWQQQQSQKNGPQTTNWLNQLLLNIRDFIAGT